MLEILRHSNGKLETLAEPEKECWINVASPTDEEIKRLKSIINIPDEILPSLKDIDEVPIFERHEKFIFIITRAPYNNLNNEFEYYTVPVGIFISDDYVVTLSYFENDAIERVKSQTFPLGKKQIAFNLFLVSAKLYLSYLNEIKKKMYALELTLEKSQKNQVIMQLLELEKSLVYFNTSLTSNDILIRAIAKDGKLVKAYDEMRLIQKIAYETKQGIEMTTIYSNILSNTLDAFASVISNNLSIVIKILTSITIVLSLPTLIASVYGMNIELPFQHLSNAFLIIMLMSFGISFLSVILLWRYRSF